MAAGTYSGTYGSIVNPSVVSFTITTTGIVTGEHLPASVYAATAHTLTNLGKVTNGSVAGAEFKAGGVITNGSSTDTSAYIKGYSTGVFLLGATAGTVTNFGIIESTFRGTGPFGYSNADYYHTGQIGFDGVYLHSGGQITNSGTAAYIYGWAGLQSESGATFITNAGTIAGYSNGVSALRGTTGLTLDNSGLIRSRVDQAIDAYSGSVSITNTGTILVTGTVTKYVSFGYVGNRYPGAIYTGAGVSAGAAITNGGSSNTTALIEGYAYGIRVYGSQGTTITNWGTIEGLGTINIGSGGTKTTPQYAIAFSYQGLAAERVIDESGSRFVGLVEGGGTDSVLELATATSAGTITGIGTQFVGFGTVAVDAGAAWNMTSANTIAATTVGTHTTNTILRNAGTIDVTGTLTLGGGGALSNTGLIKVSGGEFLANIGVGAAGSLAVGSGGRIDFASAVSSGTITFLDAAGRLSLADPAGVTLTLNGFVHGDQIDLPSVTYDTGHMTATYSGGQLSIYDNGAQKADLHLSGFSGSSFVPASDGSGHTEITALCFLAGTRIATPAGDVPIQDLTVGQSVRLHNGGAAPIIWLGRRRIAAARHPAPHKVWPVRVNQSAFGNNQPRRTLMLSPDHAVLIDGVLIPVKHLINGTTITQIAVDDIDYYHVELPRHDVLLAEGLAVESYLETGDRANFDNGDTSLRLYPDFSSRTWEAQACARLVVAGAKLAAVRAKLAMRTSPVAAIG